MKIWKIIIPIGIITSLLITFFFLKRERKITKTYNTDYDLHNDTRR
jgi:hypothetical protein